MKKMFNLVIILNMALMLFVACDDGGGGSSGEYYVKFTLNGTKYSLEKGSSDVSSVPYVKIEGSYYMMRASDDGSMIESDVGGEIKSLYCFIPTGQTVITLDDGQLCFSVVDSMNDHWNSAGTGHTQVTITITTDDSGTLAGTFTGQMYDENSTYETITDGSFKLKKI